MRVSITQTNAGTVTIEDLPEGATVADALEAAGISLGSNSVAVNGRPATTATTLSNNALVSVVGAVKGGSNR